MAVPVKTNSPVLGEILKMEPMGHYGRETGTLTGLDGKIGMVLAKRTVDATPANATAAAAGGNTGNGTITKDATTPVLAGAVPGTYRIVFIEPVTNLGTYQVFRPDGSFVGDGVVGGTFATEIKFVIADGATDFVSGDEFTFAVPAGDGKLVHCVNAAQADGSNIPWGMLMVDADASSVDQTVIVLRRGPAIVRDTGLVWHSSIDDAAKKAAKLAYLEAQGIVARTGA